MILLLVRSRHQQLPPRVQVLIVQRRVARCQVSPVSPLALVRVSSLSILVTTTLQSILLSLQLHHQLLLSPTLLGHHTMDPFHLQQAINLLQLLHLQEDINLLQQLHLQLDINLLQLLHLQEDIRPHHQLASLHQHQLHLLLLGIHQFQLLLEHHQPFHQVLPPPSQPPASQQQQQQQTHPSHNQQHPTLPTTVQLLQHQLVINNNNMWDTHRPEQRIPDTLLHLVNHTRHTRYQ